MAMAFAPELLGNEARINAERLPPRSLVPAVVEIAMVRAAERDSELVAHLAPERPRLSKAEVMSVGRGAAAD